MASNAAGMSGSGYQPAPPQKPALPRSISQTNLQTTARCRAVIQQDWVPTAPAGGTNFFTSTPYFTLTLPPLTDYPADFKHFVFDRIVDKEMQEALEGEKCLNWCGAATNLVPIFTLGDGNCLLHAASLGMWGFQDRDHILRRAVSHAVQRTQGNTFFLRWQHTREKDNSQYGLQLDPHQWQAEWQMIVKQASAEVPQGSSLDSLEEFHVFVLANILRRPIIMYAVPKFRSSSHGSTLQRVNFHGVYLPLLWDPSSCKKDPLPLAFYGGHFSALVVIEFPHQFRNGFLTLPLMDYYGQHLPVRFMLPQEDPTALMMDYLELIQLPGQSSPHIPTNTICAKLMIHEVPAYLKPLIAGFIDACHDAYLRQKPPTPVNQLTNTPQTIPNQQQYQQPMGRVGTAVGNQNPCVMGCGRFSETDSGLCLKCYQEAQSTAHEQERSRSVSGQAQQQSYNNLGPSQPSSSGGTISCPNCSNPGHPSFLGMCQACYQRSQVGVAGQQEKHYESLTDYQSQLPGNEPKPPSVPPPRVGNIDSNRSKCRSAGCDFFGTVETRFYCSKCFNENLRDILNEVGPANPLSPGVSSGKPAAMSSGAQQQHAYTSPQSAVIQGPGQPSPYETPVVMARNAEPPKCYNCKKFFGTEEQGGLCNDCFLEKTRQETQGSYRRNPVGNPPLGHPQQPYTEPQPFRPDVHAQLHQQQQQRLPQQQCKNYGCANLADPRYGNGFCARCNSAPPLPQTQPFQPQPPTPAPRPRPDTDVVTRDTAPSYDQLSREVTTAPVTDQLSRMTVSGDDTDSVYCFLCTNVDVSASARDRYSLCAKHASLVQTRMLAALPDNSKPTPKPRKKIPSQEQAATAPFTPAGPNYGQPLHTPPAPAGGPAQFSTPAETRAFGQPLPVHSQLPPAVPNTSPTYVSAQPQAGLVSSSAFGQPLPVYSQPPSVVPNTSPTYVPAQHQAGPVSSSGMNQLGCDLDRKPSPVYPSQHPGQPQGGYGLEPAEDVPRSKPRQQPAQQYQGVIGHVGANRQGVVGGHSAGAMGGGAMGGGAGGGAMGGATGFGGGGAGGHQGEEAYMKPAKVLCKVAGCSYKGVEELEGLCPDCYKEHYPVQSPQPQY